MRSTWPALPLEGWRDTYATFHMWTQIVGKIRMAQTPPLNHWWHVPLYVSARGLTTTSMPYGARLFAIDFDFVDDRLVIEDSAGNKVTLDAANKKILVEGQGDIEVKATGTLKLEGQQVEVTASGGNVTVSGTQIKLN